MGVAANCNKKWLWVSVFVICIVLQLNVIMGFQLIRSVDTRIDWKETPDAHVFMAEVQGFKKEELKVEFEDHSILQISGERNVEKKNKKDTWHRMERSSGKFMRRFKLPEINAEVDQIKASLENGVLTVTVPKMKKKLEIKAIEIFVGYPTSTSDITKTALTLQAGFCGVS